MKLQGKTIKLFIIESLKKLKTAELTNWVGKVYIGERKHSRIIQELPELQNKTGVYLLLSNKDDETQLYIGESDNVASRINQHFTDKDKQWWDKFIIFVSTSSTLTKAHVLYLEKELFLLAKENLTTIKLHNGQNPQGSNLHDYDIADMEIFLENMIFVLDNLGIVNFAKVSVEQKNEAITEDNIFYINLPNSSLQSRLVIDNNGYKLLKGSYIEPEIRKSFKEHHYNNLRNKLIEENAMILNEQGIYQAKEDIYFKSPSAAAGVIKGRAANGRIEWKLKNGKNLDDFESESTL